MVILVSLYSGCGGMDLGFINAGFKVNFAIDINRASFDTYKHNLGEQIIKEDICSIDLEDIPKMDILIAGPPCQGFSTVGKMDPNDKRNCLLELIPKIVEYKEPKIVLLENVRGLTSFQKGNTLGKLITSMKNMGYGVEYKIINSSDFGIPQNRQRVIIFANKIGINNFFESFYFKYNVSDKKTLYEAIGDIENTGIIPNHEYVNNWSEHYSVIMNRISEGQKLCNTRLGKSSIHTWEIPEVYGETTDREKDILLTISANRRLKKYRKNESWKDASPLSFEEIKGLMNNKLEKEEIEILIEKRYLVDKFEGLYDLKNTFNGKFRRLSSDKPSEAILTNFSSPRNYIHPKRNRPLTVRECARIQGFPDDFLFLGSIKEQYKMVGNAMPPKLSFFLALHIKNLLELSSY